MTKIKGGGIIVVFVAGLSLLGLYLYLFEPFRMTPELGQHLPSVTRAASVEFGNRVDALGEDMETEEQLVQFLIDQGFNVRLQEDKGLALFVKRRLVCKKRWRISWSRENGHVVNLEGRYGTTCL